MRAGNSGAGPSGGTGRVKLGTGWRKVESLIVRSSMTAMLHACVSQSKRKSASGLDVWTVAGWPKYIAGVCLPDLRLPRNNSARPSWNLEEDPCAPTPPTLLFSQPQLTPLHPDTIINFHVHAQALQLRLQLQPSPADGQAALFIINASCK